MLDHIEHLRTPFIPNAIAPQYLNRSQLDHRLHAREPLGNDSDHTAMGHDQHDAIIACAHTIDNFKHPLNSTLDAAGEVRAALAAGICEPRVEPVAIPL